MSLWYKYDDVTDSTMPQLTVYESFKHTPKGEWVRPRDMRGGSAYFVRYSSKQRSIRETPGEALEHYINRKDQQRRSLWKKILHVEALMHKAINLKEAPPHE